MASLAMTPEDFRRDYLLAITLACSLGNTDGVKNAVQAAQKAFAEAVAAGREPTAPYGTTPVGWGDHLK